MVSAEVLSAVAVKSLHPELLRYEFASAEFGNYPIWTFWRVPKRNGLILYTVSWSLLFADFGSILKYHDACFDYSTNDGPFANFNFGHFRNSERVAYINDSYDGVFLSLTPKDEFVFDTRVDRISNKLHSWWGLGTVKRLAAIYVFHRGNDLDPLRCSLHSVPIIIHGDPIDEHYRFWLARTQRYMQRAIQPTIPHSQTDRRTRALVGIHPAPTHKGVGTVHRAVRFFRRLFQLPGEFLRNRQIIILRITQAIHGDHDALKRISWRIQHTACRMIGVPSKHPDDEVQARKVKV